MSENAFQTQYRTEFVAAFERRQSMLRECVTHEAVISGNSAVFAVAGSGGATAVKRSANGKIPARTDDVTQYTCTLEEWHDLVEITNFNVFANQGNRRTLMQESTMAVINRKIDAQIITALEAGTQDTGSAVPASYSMAIYAQVILGNNDADGGNLYAAITPAFYGYMQQWPEFTSVDYVDIKPLARTNKQVKRRFSWLGIEWVVHTGLTGKGTSAEKCLMWNQDAIGHAADTSNVKNELGYDGKQDTSWARASMYMGAKLLQNSGVVVMNHDGSEFAAQ